MKWTRNETKTAADLPYTKVTQDQVKSEDGKEYEYWVEHRPDAVMVIPVRADLAEPHYVMVEQYRYPADLASLEFPAGRREPRESTRDAAVRELKQETGYEPLHLKLLYSTFENPGRSAAKLFVYLAVVQGEPSTEHMEEVERSSGLSPVQLKTAELHQKVLDNSIVDQGTLSAMAVMILQNPKASEYLGIQAPEEETE